jgi:hypothetical protein
MGPSVALLLVMAIEGAALSINAAPSTLVPGPQASVTRRANTAPALPSPVTFRVVKERGLLVSVWINDTGPYNFAIDTGAGVTLIAARVAATAGANRLKSPVLIGGLSGPADTPASNTVLRSLAIGSRGNLLRPNQKAIVVDNLPRDLDGVLDPTEAYLPLGYSIDLPGREMAAFNPRSEPLNINDEPEGGTVVRWLANGTANRKPFVRLGDGRLALLDTGSGFGLAVSRTAGAEGSRGKPGVRDIGGGHVMSERVEPTTISIGSLTLRMVPTDLLSRVEPGAPILLGRDALYPFRLTFDPLQRLIEIAPVAP